MSDTGHGAWGIGESGRLGGTEDESVGALKRAVDLGVNLIDTARGYGETERIVWTRRLELRLSVSWHRIPQGFGSPGRDGLTLATTDPEGVLALICRPSGRARSKRCRRPDVT
ncbi:aldo/keto reductase [Streptomyces sp. NPDC048254]|uniref:aldo/keto reductase n=1 Tax=Streptomyces sp. NPDC048254 TaxID=3365525 RepID=UPI00370FD24B